MIGRIDSIEIWRRGPITISHGTIIHERRWTIRIIRRRGRIVGTMIEHPWVGSFSHRIWYWRRIRQFLIWMMMMRV